MYADAGLKVASSALHGSLHDCLAKLQLSRALAVTALRVCVTPDAAQYPGVILEEHDTSDAEADANGHRRSKLWRALGVRSVRHAFSIRGHIELRSAPET